MNLPTVTYPGLALHALTASMPKAIEHLPSPPWLVDLLRPDAEAPVRGGEEVRTAVRDLLRVHGYRPTGRGKPSSEYLAAAIAEKRLGSINAPVDAGNAASLHSGLPISVVDLDLCVPPLRVDVPPAGSTFVFNRSGQTIDVGGLLCLFDANGPCANAVKDAQRTKTVAGTRNVIAVVWGSDAPDSQHAARTAAWLSSLFVRLGAAVERVAVSGA
ncbi:MAG: hypothetical protein JNK78_12735 [Planctomycetes bacterium]|nr:hypothetical protein [Planctomycetota bacterium]